jgi:hypothetical protein
MPAKDKEFPIVPSTLETIDKAFFRFIDEKLNIFSTTSAGWEKTPVIWASAERSYQIKNKKELHDDSGALVLPLIVVERTSVVKDPSRKGAFWGNVPPNSDYRNGSITVTKKMNQEKTANFARADAFRKKGQLNFPRENKKIVYKSYIIPMPVYVDITYNVILRTEYQQQMNEIMTPFITRTGGINHFVMRDDNHFYEGFIEAPFSPEGGNVGMMENEERKYQTALDIKVLGYLIGEGKNQPTPKVIMRENAVEVKIPRERIIMGDSPELNDKNAFYRE